MASEVLKIIFQGQDQTSKAVKSIQGNLRKADDSIKKIKSSLGGMTSAIGLAAGAAGFGLMARNALQAADDLGKFADRTGIAASELASMQLASNYAGVSTETFNKILVVFQKRLGEAANGTGMAKRTLDNFGISAAELSKLPLDQQLGVIADQFKNIDNPAQRAAAAADLFSNRGIKMINFLMLGSDGLGALREEFRDLGLEIEDETLDQIENFNDSVTKLKGIVQAAMIKGLADAAPQMQEVTERLTEMAVPLTTSLLEGFNYLLDNLPTITAYLKGLLAFMVASRVVAFANGIIGLVTAMGSLKVALIALRAAMGPVNILLTGLGAAAAYFHDDLADLGSEAINTGKDLLGLSDDTGDLADSMDELQEIVVTATRKPLPNFQKEVKKTAKDEKNATLYTDEFREAIENLRKEIKNPKDLVDFQKKVDALNESFEDITGTSEEVAAAQAAILEQITGIKSPIVEAKREVADLEGKLEALRNITNKSDGVVQAIAALETQLESAKGKVNDLAGADGVRLIDNYYAAIASGAESGGALDDLNEALETIQGANSSTFAKQAIEDYFKAIKKGAEPGEALDQLQEKLDGIDSSGAFGTQAINDFFTAVADGSSPSGELSQLISKMVGSDGVKDAIQGCFGTAPVKNFGDAIKDLFSGSGSPLGAFQGALGSLTDALSSFFAGGQLKFSAFKDAILRTLSEIAAGAIASVGIKFLKNLIPGFSNGGAIGEFAVGGKVTGPGGPTEDKVLAKLSSGEYVIKASTVSKYGTGFFDQLNSGRMPEFAGGGAVGEALALPGLGEIGAATPGLGQVIAVIASIIKFFQDFVPGVGMSKGEQKVAMRGELISFTNASFGAALDGIQSVFGFRPYQDITNKDQIIGTGEDVDPITVADTIIDTIHNGILGTGDSFDKHRKVTEGLKGIGTEYAELMYEYIGQRMLDIKFPQFNMEDLVAQLFTSANATAGGSLTLAARQFGGSLDKGQPSIVGENGPELFVPDRRGNVSPISKDGGRELIAAVREVKAEVAALRRQMDRQQPPRLAGGRN